MLWPKWSNILSTFLFLCSNKMLVMKVETHKMLVKIANKEDLDDLRLHCLSRLFWQELVFNF